MDIKRQVTRGGKVFAYELVDGDETYFVHKDALVNDVILPELIRSGWKLVSLPMGLKKNGMALDELPKVERSFTLEEEMDMQIPRGGEIPMEELRKMVTTDIAEAQKQEAGVYTINTREEFLDYLVASSITKDPQDFLPINYFVHPAARFSPEEYKDPANQRWLRIMENRRALSVEQFENLREWAVTMGLSKDYSSNDLLFFYFRWGICGLNLEVISKSQQSYSFHKGTAPADPESWYYYQGYGLIDYEGNLVRETVARTFKIADAPMFERTRFSCDRNEVRPVRLRERILDVIEEWNTVTGPVDVGFDGISVLGINSPSLRVQYKSHTIPRHLLRYDKREEFKADIFLRAISEQLLSKRIVRADVSTYKALTNCSCSPLSALKAVLTNINSMLEADDPNLGVHSSDVELYLKNELADGPIKSIFDEFLNGDISFGSLAKGNEADCMQTASDVYNYLYCAHHIMNIPMDEIFRRVRDFQQGDQLSFTANGKTLNVPSAPICAAYNGYLKDVQDYEKHQLDECYSMLWVDLVTRVPSSGESNKHVGLRCYRLDKFGKDLTQVLQNMESIYAKAVRERVADPAERAALLSRAPFEAPSMLFQSILSGGYRFEKAIGGVYRPTEEERNAWRKARWFNGPFYTDTVSICDIVVSGDEWCIYPVNAIITPYRVKPRKGYMIRETSLNAVWDDLSSLPIYGEVRQNRAVMPSDGIWHNECWSHPYFQDPHHFGLVDYYREAEEYRMNDDGCKLQDAPHILEMKYPIFAVEREAPAAAPGDTRTFSCGHGKVLSYEEEVILRKDDHTQVYPYICASADDLYYTKGKYSLPSTIGKKPVIVIDGCIFIDGVEIRPADVENLNPNDYPVTHLQGRRYVIADNKKRLWIVEV